MLLPMHLIPAQHAKPVPQSIWTASKLHQPHRGKVVLMQAMSESEMHIGLSSSGFGDISIRTSVSNHQMLAQISLDHSELSQAISAHVSSVQAKLSDDYGLRASIEINNLPSSHSGEPGGSSQREKGAVAASLPGESTAAQGEERSGVGQEVW